MRPNCDRHIFFSSLQSPTLSQSPSLSPSISLMICGWLSISVHTYTHSGFDNTQEELLHAEEKKFILNTMIRHRLSNVRESHASGRKRSAALLPYNGNKRVYVQVYFEASWQGLKIKCDGSVAMTLLKQQPFWYQTLFILLYYAKMNRTAADQANIYTMQAQKNIKCCQKAEGRYTLYIRLISRQSVRVWCWFPLISDKMNKSKVTSGSRD